MCLVAVVLAIGGIGCGSSPDDANVPGEPAPRNRIGEVVDDAQRMARTSGPGGATLPGSRPFVTKWYRGAVPRTLQFRSTGARERSPDQTTGLFGRPTRGDQTVFTVIRREVPGDSSLEEVTQSLLAYYRRQGDLRLDESSLQAALLGGEPAVAFSATASTPKGDLGATQLVTVFDGAAYGLSYIPGRPTASAKEMNDIVASWQWR